MKKGDKVHVINMNISGRYFVEGRATIVRKVRGVYQTYDVCFDGDTGTYQRFVDQEAQANPAEFVRRLNDPN